METLTSLHVVGSPALGGAEHFLLRLTAALTGAGHPATAVVQRGSAVAAAVGPGVERVELPLRRGLDLRSPGALRSLVRDRAPAAIQTYMARATRMTRLRGPRRTLHVARLGGRYRLRDFRHADVWVGNTRGLCQWLVEAGFPSQRVFHIGNFVEPRGVGDPGERARRRREWGVPEPAFVLAALGRFDARKGFQDLIEAVGLLSPSRAGERPFLLLAGEGREAPALEAAAGTLADRVRIGGWVAGPDALLPAADLCVVPSREETLGNVVLEAWAHGIPVVATRTDGPSELIEDGVNGRLAPAADPAGLARVLESAWAAGPDGRRAWVEAGREALERTHGRRAVLDAYLALYADAERWIRR